MSETYTNCPNCNSEIKNGVFNKNAIVHVKDSAINFIREFTDNKAEAYCERCNYTVANLASENFKKKLVQAKSDYQELLKHIPIITLQVPLHWEYTVIGMLTSQSVTGTGVVSEISSSISDFFGMQSGNLNRKLKNGENICAAQLRSEAILIGANAIIGTDVDYTEVGGDKGMLMVCMSGTAVKLKNTEVMSALYAEKMVKLSETVDLIKSLQKQETANTIAN